MGDFIGLIVTIIVVYCCSGIKGLCEMFQLTGYLFKSLNDCLLLVTNHSLLDYLFGTTITYIMVGFILRLLSIPKNKFGKFCGKVAFKLITIPVAFVLDWIAKLIF